MAGYLRIVDSRGGRIPARALSGDYEAAGTGRRLGTWGMSTSGPDNTLFSSLSSLRSRSRQLVRDDPQIDGGMLTWTANLVGNGITPRWLIEDQGLKEAIRELWSDWTKEADFDGILDFYGLQTLQSREIIEAGEIFIRYRFPRSDEGLTVPLQLQLFEGDHVDHTYNTIAPNGNKIRMGIELDGKNRRVAYWVWPEHPGESYMYMENFDRVRIPASEILHVYLPLRAGQKRGRPWLTSLITLMHELNAFGDAELVRKKTAAMFGGFIIDHPSDEGDLNPYYSTIGKREGQDDKGRDIVALEPGTFPVLDNGSDVKFSQPADVGGNYEAFVRHQEHRAARGFGGLPYEKFTGDLNGVTYSSIRSGNLEFQRICKQIIYNVLVFQSCRPIAQKWLETAVISGAGGLDIVDYLQGKKKYHRIKWDIDGWPWVDPLKDIEAEKKAVRGGFKSRAQSVGEQGRDVEEVDTEIAQDNARADKLGLVLDSDPRKTSAQGKTENEENAETNR